MRWALRAAVAAGLALAVAGGLVTARSQAEARTTVQAMRLTVPAYQPVVPVQRVGLNCRHTEHLLWGAQYCVTLRARKVGGRWWVQPAAAVAGYNAQGRRTMRFAIGLHKAGRGLAKAGKRKRLVVRGRWRPAGRGVDDTRAVFVIRFPDGHKSVVRLATGG
jgi:hypothetical protein